MKKIVLGLMVAVIAISVASAAYAGEGNGKERGEGRWKQWFQVGKWFSHGKNDSDDDRKDNGNHYGWYGECGKNARIAMGDAMKTAFGAFVTAKKAAQTERAADIAAANGDQAKIAKAWQEYQDAFIDAWKEYTDATIEAMEDYGTAFGACDIVIRTPTPTPSTTVTPTPTASPSTTPLPTYTMATVQTHNTLGSCWAVVSGKVYDLTRFISKHPGGTTAITGLCGTDATSAFTDQHDGEQKPATMLARYLIGTLN